MYEPQKEDSPDAFASSAAAGAGALGGVSGGDYSAEYSSSLSNLNTPFESREGSPMMSGAPSWRSQVASPVRSPRAGRLTETITLPASASRQLLQPFASALDERSLSETNLVRGAVRGGGRSGARDPSVETRATQTVITTDRSTNTTTTTTNAQSETVPAPTPAPRASRASGTRQTVKSAGGEGQTVPNLSSDDIEHWLQFIHSNAGAFNNTAP